MNQQTISDITTDVAIIGAGPSGALAAALLRRSGHTVLVLERERFPRFSIGESLLPQSMAYLEAAGMLQAVVEAGFQYKNGAHFVRGTQAASYDFRDKHSTGWGTTYQVARAEFDTLLIGCASADGAIVRFEHEVLAVETGGAPTLEVRNRLAPADSPYRVHARFILDASGFGRVLPRLLKLETPSRMPVRGALFSHVDDRLPAGSIDRDKICIAIHPEYRDVWYWMIPLAGGRSSVGVVAEPAFLEAGLPADAVPGSDAAQAWRTARLRELLRAEPHLGALLGAAPFCMPVRQISGYAANVTALHGPGYALLGNAGEFLDPVFSSGVTIALRSASLAANALERQLRGQAVDWLADYDQPLRRGIDTFRAFIERWYSGELQDIIFYPDQSESIRRMISAVLAGYAWDETNPFVAEPERRLDALYQLCKNR